MRLTGRKLILNSTRSVPLKLPTLQKERTEGIGYIKDQSGNRGKIKIKNDDFKNLSCKIRIGGGFSYDVKVGISVYKMITGSEILDDESIDILSRK